MEERDYELLDAHLDDALSPIDAEHLRTRLAAEPELAAALETLRAERAARAEVWRSMEPTTAQAAAIATSVLRSGRRSELLRRTGRHIAALAAAAACIAVGWFGRGVVAGGAANSLGGSSATALNTASLPAARADGTYRVALTDSAGNVVAVQMFNRPDEAQRFATDLAQWQATQQQPRPTQLRSVSDEF
jgi:anti-sigma factor RsiW